MREHRMYSKISKLFENNCYIFYNYVIPDNSKREIDIICLEKFDFSEVIGIEVKLRDWKKALRQAFKRLFYVDRCYIAISKDYVNCVNLNKIAKHGIGLISVDGCAEIVIEAKKSDKVLSWRKEMLLNDLIKRVNCGGDIL